MEADFKSIKYLDKVSNLPHPSSLFAEAEGYEVQVQKYGWEGQELADEGVNSNSLSVRIEDVEWLFFDFDVVFILLILVVLVVMIILSRLFGVQLRLLLLSLDCVRNNLHGALSEHDFLLSRGLFHMLSGSTVRKGAN